MSPSFIRFTNTPKRIVRGTIPQGGTSPTGETYTVNNYFFEKDGRPFFAIAGEFHYSRCDQRFWEAGLAKMKAGGINLVSTYVFWNHHEEVEGVFDWTGLRDLRRFLTLCHQFELKAIVRLGPFCHGEVRNGGVPDWLYGQPFEIRSNDAEYLSLVRRLYGQISLQLRGQFLQDGGPVLALQIENEYQHSAAPWETTTGTTNQWLPGGRDGRDHMLALKALAREVGMEAPFWTATAWGGACVPVPELLPLWGGYAYQPWLFYGETKNHPVTPEFLFRDYHNSQNSKTYNFEPAYDPEDYPYSCCEMGGGMQVWYPYRFTIPPASVEAMAIVKFAGGCNFLGYYMYHGGTNPRGKVNPFLNEHTVPKLSYDFQAPLGEWGQPREHFHRLRLLHLFLKTWESWITPLPSVVPPGAGEISPQDNAAVRWALRTDGRSGLLCVTNFQDHWQRDALNDLSWELSSSDGLLRLPAAGTVGLAPDESCVLPFRLPLGTVTLVSATAQPVTGIQAGGISLWVFAVPAGMEPIFRFSRNDTLDVRAAEVIADDEGFTVKPRMGEAFSLTSPSGKEEVLLVLAKADALDLQKIVTSSGEYLVRSKTLVLANPAEPGFWFEGEGDGPWNFSVFPELPPNFEGGARLIQKDTGLFSTYSLELPRRPAPGDEVSLEKRGTKGVVTVNPQALEGVTSLLLRVDYRGDVGNAFIGGQLVADNFCNGQPWDIDLARLEPNQLSSGLSLDIVPLKKGARVMSDTTMAGRTESYDEAVGSLDSVSVVPVRTIRVGPRS